MTNYLVLWVGIIKIIFFSLRFTFSINVVFGHQFNILLDFAKRNILVRGCICEIIHIGAV